MLLVYGHLLGQITRKWYSPTRPDMPSGKKRKEHASANASAAVQRKERQNQAPADAGRTPGPREPARRRLHALQDSPDARTSAKDDPRKGARRREHHRGRAVRPSSWTRRRTTCSRGSSARKSRTSSTTGRFRRTKSSASRNSSCCGRNQQLRSSSVSSSTRVSSSSAISSSFGAASAAFRLASASTGSPTLSPYFARNAAICSFALLKASIVTKSRCRAWWSYPRTFPSFRSPRQS